MPLPINISDLINRRVVENARVEYRGDWNPEPILHSMRILLFIICHLPANSLAVGNTYPGTTIPGHVDTH